MSPVEGDELDPSVEIKYRRALFGDESGIDILRIGRFEFYERVKKSSVVVMTGETAKYGNIILKKGVTPLS